MQNVEGRVVIAIQNDSAFVAMVDANTERFPLSRFASATGTDLGRSARVHGSHDTRSFFRFRVQDADELTPTRIVHAFGENRAGESTDVQVFDCNVIELPHQIECGLEVEIPPRTLDASVLAGENTNHLPTPATSLLPLTNPPLSALQLGFGGAKVARIWECAPVAQRQERSEPYIDPGFPATRRQRLLCNPLAAERHEPVPAGVSAKRHDFHLAFDRSREKQAEGSKATQGQALAVQPPAILPKRHAVVATSTSESWESPLTFEESGKGEINAFQDIAKCLRVYISELWPLASDVLQLRVLVEPSHSRSTHPPRIAPLLNRGVVELATKRQLRLSLPRNGWGQLRLVPEASTHTSI
jgi:hypothetical protein